MDRTLDQAVVPSPSRSHPRSILYPFERLFFVCGLGVGVLGGTLLLSPLAGFAFLTVFVVIGALWRRNELPVLAFCLTFQWLFVVVSYLRWEVTGEYLGLNAGKGDLETAVFLSLTGLLVIAAGIRFALLLSWRWVASAKYRLEQSIHPYDLGRVFWMVIAVFMVDWFLNLSQWFGQWEMAFTMRQLILNVMLFRYALLVVLFLSIAQRRKGYSLGAVALLFVMGPHLSSEFSIFKEVFMLPLLVALGQWRPWTRSVSNRLRGSSMLWLAMVLGALLTVMVLLWVGVAKPVWRDKVFYGEVQGGPIQKAGQFISVMSESVGDVNWGVAFESLAGRAGTGVGYLSIVLERVPEILPHENGALTMHALKHSVTPRVLFHDKPILENTSVTVNKYTGVKVAGDQQPGSQAGSIGFGYMTEVYIDFGVLGMFVPLFFLGLIVGLIVRVLLRLSPSYTFYLSSTTVLLVWQFKSYEGHLAFLLGGLLMNFVVFAVLLLVVGPWLHRRLAASGPHRTPGHDAAK